MEFVRTEYDVGLEPDIIYKQHVDVTNENSFVAKAIIKSVKDKLETILKPLGLTYSVYFNLSNLFVKIDYNTLDKTFNKEENI